MNPSTQERPDPLGRISITADAGRLRVVEGIVGSALLAAVKIISGLLGNSYALVADGIESMLDVVSSLAVWSGLKLATQPPDAGYPFGYGKAEPLASLVVSVALFAAALGIAIQSVREILTPHHLPAGFTLVVLVAVVIVKETFYRRLFRAGTRIGSRAVQADAWHHRSDALTSLAAFTGISVALAGGEGYESADDWAALFACGVIAANGVRILRGSLREILDAAPPAQIEQTIRDIAMQVEGVFALDKCRVRKSGLFFFVDLHVIVNGEIPVREGHAVAHRVKDALLAAPHGIVDVDVHIEPDSVLDPTSLRT